MPTIYFDESSRGYHGNQGRTPHTRGRWVGEKMENGRRIRMRSTDYKKVVAWMNKQEGKRIPLKGLTNYSIDVDRRELYGKSGQVRKGEKACNVTKYRLQQDGVKYTISWPRMAYAALNGIDVTKIPSDLVVYEHDGEYVLSYRGDFISCYHSQQRTERRKFISNTLNKRKREIEILQRYYSTNDTAELVTYATTDCFDYLLRYVLKQRGCTIDRARDIVLEATEQFLQRVTEEDTPVISISHHIKGLCAHVMKEHRKNMEYNDNLKIIGL